MGGLIVHEWLAERGGSENVVHAMSEAFPDSDLWVLWNNDLKRFPHARQSWLAHTPLRRSRVAALPAMPATWRFVRGDHDYDWVMASSHLFAHHVRVPRQPVLPKLAYVHTPARYIWTPEIDGRGNSAVARAASRGLRRLDRQRAAELTSVAGNSGYIRERIRRSWGIDASVIYPPVDVARILAVESWADRLSASEEATFTRLPQPYLLGASRFVSYKRLEVVIEIGERLGLPVVLAGAGPERGNLAERAAIAAVPVQFVESPSSALLFALYQNAYAYVFPPIEDFGIMPVEAMACGTPVIVNATGGARESVEACRGGQSIAIESTVDVLAAAHVIDSVDRAALRERTRRFSRERFIAEVQEWVSDTCGSSVVAEKRCSHAERER
ncbi:MAG: glycosyltransferase [Micropruina sp.]|uniref:glycosyltransferase n=1 Tax=Micropruina sp. TaxID=2737536 RepID=UPI0039E240AC